MNNLFDLTGKTALVTGKSGLLAPIWKETLENAGADVLCVEPPAWDICNKERMRSLSIQYEPGIIINNAALDNPPHTKSTFFGNCENIIAVNLQGAVNVCEAFIPGMIQRGGGVIVNIGSIQGYGGADWRNYDGDFEKPFGYNASKWALRGLAKSITVQYGRYGIRCVTPSFSAYDGGLSEEFRKKFVRNVPLGKAISKESMQQTLLYAVCCEDLAGIDWRVDAGLGAWA